MNLLAKQKNIIICYILCINALLSILVSIYYEYWYIFISILALSSSVNSINVLLIITNQLRKISKNVYKNVCKNVCKNVFGNASGLIEKVERVEREKRKLLYVLPCYNENEIELRKTIDSIVSQKDCNIHKFLIIICDGKIKGIGNIFLQPDVNDARYFQIYNTAAPSGNDIHFKGNADFNYFGDDINYLKIDDSAQTVSIVGVNGLFVSGNIYQTGSLYVDGTITAKELHINYVTSSVLYSSGSTKFGDTSDDLHLFTGSLRTSGSVVINGDLTVNGTTTLTSTDVLRESLIISGAMAIMQAQIQAQIVSASLSMQGQVVISQQVNINIMDLGGF